MACARSGDTLTAAAWLDEEGFLTRFGAELETSPQAVHRGAGRDFSGRRSGLRLWRSHGGWGGQVVVMEALRGVQGRAADVEEMDAGYDYDLCVCVQLNEPTVEWFFAAPCTKGLKTNSEVCQMFGPVVSRCTCSDGRVARVVFARAVKLCSQVSRPQTPPSAGPG